MKEENHLMLLMNKLSITGKEMALSVGINTTLLSKYRNNKRKMDLSVIKEISHFVVFDYCQESSVYMNTLKEILEPYSNKNIDICEPEELSAMLSDYLLEDTTEEVEYLNKDLKGNRKAVMEIFMGNEGWMKLTDLFLENAGTYEVRRKKPDIYIGEFVFFDYGRKENYDLYYHADRIYTELLNRGHKLVIITTIKEKYQSYEGLIKWLKLYAHDDIEVYCVEFPDTWDFNRSILVEKDKQAFVNLDAKRQYDKDIYIHTKEEAIIDYYYQMLLEIQKHSSVLVKKIKLFHHTGFTANILNLLVEGRVLYFLDTMPCYRNMPEALLCEVLNDNNVYGAARESVMKRYQLWNQIYQKNMCRCIFDIEEITNVLKCESHVDYELSYLVGREVEVKREQLLEQFQYILYENEWQNFKVANYSFSKLMLVYEYITMLVQGDNILAMWSAKSSATCIHYRDNSIIGGCRRYVEDLWESMPQKCKNVDSFMDKINNVRRENDSF